MRPKQIGFAQCREHCEKGFRRAHLFAKLLERVGQRVANGKTEHHFEVSHPEAWLDFFIRHHYPVKGDLHSGA